MVQTNEVALFGATVLLPKTTVAGTGAPVIPTVKVILEVPSLSVLRFIVVLKVLVPGQLSDPVTVVLLSVADKETVAPEVQAPVTGTAVLFELFTQ